MARKKTMIGSKITNYFNGTIFIQYESSDFKKTIDFYEKGLDLEPSDFTKNGPNPDKVGLYEFQLPSKGAILSFSKAQEGKIKVNDNLVIMVTNIDSLRDDLMSKQIVASEIKDVPNLLSFFTVKDPDSNIVMFISDPRKK